MSRRKIEKQIGDLIHSLKEEEGQTVESTHRQYSSVVEELSKTLHGKILHTLDRKRVEQNATSIWGRPDYLYDICYAVLRVKNRDNENIILACMYDDGCFAMGKLLWIAYPCEMGKDKNSPSFEQAKVIPLSKLHMDKDEYGRVYDGQQQFTDSTLDLLEKAHMDIANAFREGEGEEPLPCVPWNPPKYERVIRHEVIHFTYE